MNASGPVCPAIEIDAITSRGLIGLDRIPVHADAAHYARRVVLDQDIGFAHQFMKDGFGLGMVGIDCKAALAVIVLKEIGAGAVAPQSEGARAVALGRGLDLDHLGAHLGEDSGAGGSGHKLGEIEDAVTLKHSGFFGHVLMPPEGLA